jgi:hypothetical protein
MNIGMNEQTEGRMKGLENKWVGVWKHGLCMKRLKYVAGQCGCAV